MLFRCYSWGSFSSEVYANDVTKEFPLSTPDRKHPPKWGFNFLQIFISFFFVHLKVSSDCEKKFHWICYERSLRNKKDFLVVCASS